MPSITREEVAHLARLARIELSDDELDHLAPQLDQIIALVGQVSEAAAERVPVRLAGDVAQHQHVTVRGEHVRHRGARARECRANGEQPWETRPALLRRQGVIGEAAAPAEAAAEGETTGE